MKIFDKIFNKSIISNNIFLSPEIWLLIITKLINIDKESIEYYDISSILSLFSTSKYLQTFSNNYIWKILCKKFTDFNSLYRKSNIIPWKDIYYMRVNSIYKYELLKIGDKKILIYIKGNGECFISVNKKYCECDDTHFNIYINNTEFHILPFISVMNSMWDTNNIFKKVSIYMPFTIKYKTRKCISRASIIDICAYEPTILMLSKGGKVFEWMFTPDKNCGYNKYTVPIRIHFPYDTYIIKIFNTPLGSYAISSDNKVFVWTIYDHPVTMEKIRSAPIHLTMLDDYCISNITQTSSEYTTFISTQNLTIENSQIYYLILSNETLV